MEGGEEEKKEEEEEEEVKDSWDMESEEEEEEEEGEKIWLMHSKFTLPLRKIYTSKLLLLFHQSPTRHGDYTVTGQ